MIERQVEGKCLCYSSSACSHNIFRCPLTTTTTKSRLLNSERDMTKLNICFIVFLHVTSSNGKYLRIFRTTTY